MPFLPLLMAAAPLISKVLGGASKGSADQRYNENNQRLQQAQMANSYNLQSAQLRNSDALNRAQLDLQQRAFQQQEPGAQARMAMAGNLLERLQPLQLSGLSDRVSARMPQMNNSILSALGPEARQAGALLAQRGVTGLQHPTQFTPMAPVQIPALEQAKLQQAGLLEKILGGVGLGASVVGALGNLNSVGGGNGQTYLPSDENGFG